MKTRTMKAIRKATKERSVFYLLAGKVLAAADEPEYGTAELRKFIENSLGKKRYMAYQSADTILAWFNYGICNDLFNDGESALKYYTGATNLIKLYNRCGLYRDQDFLRCRAAAKLGGKKLLDKKDEITADILAIWPEFYLEVKA